MNKLSVAYKTVFRNFFNVFTGTYGTKQKMLYNCDPMPVILRKLLFYFFLIALHSQQFLQDISQLSFYYHSSMTQEWSKLLFRVNV